MRSQTLKHLKLKTVIKESHCSPVQHLDMNMCDADCRNLFATVGKDQVTIYDDMHMGDHISVVANLALSSNVEAAKDAFHACCWINTSGLTRHPYGDALLAVGGSDPHVHIISVVEAAVVGWLPLPAGTSVAELSAATHCPGLLLVLGRDGTLQLWQISTGTCLWSCKTDAFTAALHPRGSCALTANRTGKLSRWDLQGLDMGAGSGCASHAEVIKAAWVEGQHSDSAVDCIRFLTEELVASKTCDGHMAVHTWPSGELISSWKVPGSGSSSTPSYSKRCCFGHTHDGRYLCVGNHMAAAYVYDTRTGQQVTRVEAIRVQGSVRACGLSEDCSHLLMVVGHGYVFRFECKQTADKEAEVEESSMADADADAADAAEAQQVLLQAAGQLQQQQPLLQQQPSLQQQPMQQEVPRHEQQQEQQGQLPPASQLGDGTPSHAADTAAAAQGQQQHTPGGYQGALPAEFSDVDMAAPQSGGSLDAFMGVDDSPAAATSAEASAGQQQHCHQQQQSRAGVSSGQARLQQASARAHSDTDDSPLVFRPTPRKQ